VRVSYPHRYSLDAESSIRVVPVERGLTCDNGARLFVVAVELWPDFTYVHYAMLRVDDPRPGHFLPHPDVFSLELALSDEFDYQYRPAGWSPGSGVGTGEFQRSEKMFEPIRPEAHLLTIVPANATWKGWTIATGEAGIVVDLDR